MNVIGARKAELAALRRGREDLRVHFPEALVEGGCSESETVSTALSRADQGMYAAKGRSLRSKRR